MHAFKGYVAVLILGPGPICCGPGPIYFGSGPVYFGPGPVKMYRTRAKRLAFEFVRARTGGVDRDGEGEGKDV